MNNFQTQFKPPLNAHINTIQHCDFLTNDLPDGCAQLIISDPPYYEVKGAFDFIWPNLDAYLADVEKWAAECARLLAPNGTLIWWGHAKKIAYSQIVLDQYLKLINACVWEKIDCQTRKDIHMYRSFAPVTERFLVYEKEEIQEARAALLDQNDLFWSLKEFFDSGLDQWGVSRSQATNIIGSSATHWFGFTKRPKKQFSIPSLEKYQLMQAQGNYWPREHKEVKGEFLDLMASYDDIRLEYKLARRPFDNLHKLTDVMQYLQGSWIDKEASHPTRKPFELTEHLIETTTREDGLVIVPFAGSGTECCAALKKGRSFIGYEIEKEDVARATKRLNKYRGQSK